MGVVGSASLLITNNILQLDSVNQQLQDQSACIPTEISPPHHVQTVVSTIAFRSALRTKTTFNHPSIRIKREAGERSFAIRFSFETSTKPSAPQTTTSCWSVFFKHNTTAPTLASFLNRTDCRPAQIRCNHRRATQIRAPTNDLLPLLLLIQQTIPFPKRTVLPTFCFCNTSTRYSHLRKSLQ